MGDVERGVCGDDSAPEARAGNGSRKTLYAKLAAEACDGKVHVYELSEPITMGVNGVNFMERDREDSRKEFRDDELNKQIPDECRMVSTSIAITHAEKLVFRAARLKYHGETIYTRIGSRIDGAITFMTQGGDPRTMKPDPVYLRRLAGFNGMRFGGVVDEFPGTEGGEA